MGRSQHTFILSGCKARAKQRCALFDKGLQGNEMPISFLQGSSAVQERAI